MIPLAKPYVDKQELNRIAYVMSSGCMAGTCEEVKLFEEDFAEYIGSKYAVATSSCTTALHIACRLLGVGVYYNKVTVPAYTFPATGLAPKYCKCNTELKLMDVREDTYNISPENSMQFCQLLIPVHSFGNPCDMPAIMDIAEDKNIKVIEDSACAVASTLDGKHTGTFGDIGCYSFYGIKELCTGEGGMLVTDNEEYAKMARSLVDFGKTISMPLPKFEHLGYNYRLSAIQAAMGRIQLLKLPQMHSMRKHVANIYNRYIDDEFEGLVTRQNVIDNAVHSYQRYSVVLNSKFNRNKVMEEMKKEGVQTSIGTYDLSSIPLYQSSNLCPVSKNLFNQSISLPMYPGLTDDQAEQVMSTFCDVLKRLS